MNLPRPVQISRLGELRHRGRHRVAPSGREGSASHERPADRTAFLADAARFTPIVASDVGPATVLVHTDEKHISRQVFESGRYGDRAISHALKLLDARGALPRREDAAILDVGANIGTVSLSLLVEHGFGRALAFEPEPANYRLLACNFLLNGLGERTLAYPVAVSARDGEITLRRSKAGNAGGHKVVAAGPSVPAPRAGKERSERLTQVEAVTLDSLVGRGEISPEEVALVWVDTQGHEPQVLRGAGRLLDHGVPWVVEFSPTLLQRAGELEEMEGLIASSFAHVADLRRGRGFIPVERMREITDRYRERGFTDLLLVRA